MCSKKIGIFSYLHELKLIFVSFATNLLFYVSFSASIRVILAQNCPINSLQQFLYGKPELSTTIINIITYKPRSLYLSLF